MLSQFDLPFESSIKPQIVLLLQENAGADNLSVSQKHKTLKVLKKIAKRSVQEQTPESETPLEPPLKKKKLEVPGSSESEDSGGEENEISGIVESKTGMFLRKKCLLAFAMYLFLF